MDKLNFSFHFKISLITFTLALTGCEVPSNFAAQEEANSAVAANPIKADCGSYAYIQDPMGIDALLKDFELPIPAGQSVVSSTLEISVNDIAVNDYQFNQQTNIVSVRDAGNYGDTVFIGYCTQATAQPQTVPLPIFTQVDPITPEPEAPPVVAEPNPPVVAVNDPPVETPPPAVVVVLPPVEVITPPVVVVNNPPIETPPPVVVTENPPAAAIELPPVVISNTGVCGPMVFTRHTAKPFMETVNCHIADTSRRYTLQINNAGISSAVVYVNGQKVFSQSNFNRRVLLLETKLFLQADNQISVQLMSKPGANITVTIK